MKRVIGLLAFSAILLLTSCQKDAVEKSSTKEDPQLETCSFGIDHFSLSKRATVIDEVSRRKPQTGGGSGGTTGGITGGTTGGTTTTSSNVIFLDFDGQYVSGTNWNTSGDINCAPANINVYDANLILQRVAADYSPFNITVTTDEAVYNSANAAKRMRVIVTETWEPFGQAGGVSYIGSFTWGNNTPCFVFSSLLSYNSKAIAEACSHEAGHTLGLRHQSVYDATGIKINEYNWGQGSGEIGWAPIMGASYNQNLTLWHYGPTNISSTSMQDDVSKIASVVGLVADDYSNTISNAAVLSTSRTGIINNSNDADFFSVSISTTKTVSLAPISVGSGNDGADLDLVLNIYNSQGALVSSINDPSVLNASITLSPGSYYVSASTTDNQFTTRYGMLSNYTISLN